MITAILLRKPRHTGDTGHSHNGVAPGYAGAFDNFSVECTRLQGHDHGHSEPKPRHTGDTGHSHNGVACQGMPFSSWSWLRPTSPGYLSRPFCSEISTQATRDIRTMASAVKVCNYLFIFRNSRLKFLAGHGHGHGESGEDDLQTPIWGGPLPSFQRRTSRFWN
jgi:hypothetical protein